MPGLIRKLLIYGSVHGLIVQSHGPVDHHKAIHIDYNTRKITAYPSDDASQGKKDVSLEAHGLIGDPSKLRSCTAPLTKMCQVSSLSLLHRS